MEAYCVRLHLLNLLKDMNYDSQEGMLEIFVIYNEKLQNNQTDNVKSCFYAKLQSIAIIMDEIDGMNSGDKGGLNTLIKLIWT